MQRFLIIDGNAIVHRAFHALPPLTDLQGRLVNAVYGFFSMLLKVIEDVKPTHIAICFDRPAPTFRKTLFVGYQAHRPQMADGLSDQFHILHDALEEIGVTFFEVDGYEADDLIGTLARQAVQNTQKTQQSGISDMSESLKVRNSESSEFSENIDIKIVTGDRDLLQLVNDRVHILFPILGITKMTEYDAKAVEEKFGVKPEQFIDYKALIGDSSDGYPGVTGIGPKTAAGLLQKYHSFENLYHNLSHLPEKTAERLATDIEQASLAKTLATIVTDAPITLKMDQCLVNNIDKETTAEVFEKLSFESLKKRLDAVKSIKTKKEIEMDKLGKQMSLL